jgi:hypothetical protein
MGSMAGIGGSDRDVEGGGALRVTFARRIASALRSGGGISDGGGELGSAPGAAATGTAGVDSDSDMLGRQGSVRPRIDKRGSRATHGGPDERRRTRNATREAPRAAQETA